MTSTVDVDQTLRLGLEKLVECSGVVAKYCDRAEHNESFDPHKIREVGQTLRTVAQDIATKLGLSLRSLYADRIGRIEAAHVLGESGSYDGAAAISTGQTWRSWQLAQADHDHVYHQDVAGLAKTNQLSHFGHHIAKLAWLMQQSLTDPGMRREFMVNRLPDIMIFGVKLATVTGQRLPEELIEF
jgi:hypothetical protein